MKNHIIKMSLCLLCFLISTFVSFSQGLPDAPGGDDDPILDPAPIDDFIWILILAALLLGIHVFIKKTRLKKKRITTAINSY